METKRVWKYNIVERAIQEALNKQAAGLLVLDTSTVPENEDEFWSTPNGDRETIYSIASLYSNDIDEGEDVDEAREEIEDALLEKFGLLEK